MNEFDAREALTKMLLVDNPDSTAREAARLTVFHVAWTNTCAENAWNEWGDRAAAAALIEVLWQAQQSSDFLNEAADKDGRFSPDHAVDVLVKTLRSL